MTNKQNLRLEVKAAERHAGAAAWRSTEEALCTEPILTNAAFGFRQKLKFCQKIAKIERCDFNNVLILLVLFLNCACSPKAGVAGSIPAGRAKNSFKYNNLSGDLFSVFEPYGNCTEILTAPEQCFCAARRVRELIQGPFVLGKGVATDASYSTGSALSMVSWVIVWTV